MKKITLIFGLFLALLVSVPMQAQTWYYNSETPIRSAEELTTGRYIISVWCKGYEGLLHWTNSNADGSNFSVSTASAHDKTLLDASGDDQNYMWDIVKAEDGSFTIQSVKSGKFTSKQGATAEGRGNTKAVASGDANIATHAISRQVDISGIPHFTIKMTNGQFTEGTTKATTYFHCNGNSGLGTGNDNLHLSYWKCATENDEIGTANNVTCDKMAFYPVELQEADSIININYEYYFNDQPVGTLQTNVTAAINKKYPTPAPTFTIPAFCSVEKPEGTVKDSDANQNLKVKVTWNGPFEYTATVENAKWYLLTESRQTITEDNEEKTVYPVMRYNPDNEYITLKSADHVFTNNKADQWAFVGNPFNGFKIYNRAADNARLISTTNVSSSNDGNTNPYVSTEPLTDTENYTEKWDVHEQETASNQSLIAEGFAISQHGDSNKKLNNRSYNNISSDPRLAYWYGHSDNGSTFTASQKALPPIRLNGVNDKSYSTFYIDYPVLVDDSDVTIYTGVRNGNVLEMKEVADNIIPANVGVVLVGNSASKTTVQPAIANEAGSAEQGSLTGTLTDLNIDGSQTNYLVLGRSKDTAVETIGFYRPSSTSIPAYKAYIDNSGNNSVRGLSFSFDGETTAIEDVVATPSAQQAIYDLSGRRVTKAVKGIYIMGGKKIYVK